MTSLRLYAGSEYLRNILEENGYDVTQMTPEAPDSEPAVHIGDRIIRGQSNILLALCRINPQKFRVKTGVGIGVANLKAIKRLTLFK